MKLRIVAAVLLLLFQTSAIATITLSSSVQMFQEGLARKQPLEELLVAQLDESYKQATLVLTSAIATSPGSIVSIVNTAVDYGVNSDVIADQCETALTVREIELLVQTTLVKRANPLPLIRRCLSLVRESEISGLITLAINNSGPGTIGQIVLTSFDSLSGVIGDPFLIVKQAVLNSSAVVVEGLELAEDVQDLVVDLRLNDQLEEIGADQVTSEQISDLDSLDDTDEGGLSGS